MTIAWILTLTAYAAALIVLFGSDDALDRQSSVWLTIAALTAAIVLGVLA